MKQTLVPLTIKHFFLQASTVNLDDYEIKLIDTTYGPRDQIEITITDKLTNETVPVKMYALEVVHLMVGEKKAWANLGKEWTAKTPEKILGIVAKNLTNHGLNLDANLTVENADVVYLGEDAMGFPIVRINLHELEWVQTESIIHLPVRFNSRPVQSLLAVDYKTIDSSKLGEV